MKSVGLVEADAYTVRPCATQTLLEKVAKSTMGFNCTVATRFAPVPVPPDTATDGAEV